MTLKWLKIVPLLSLLCVFQLTAKSFYVDTVEQLYNAVDTLNQTAQSGEIYLAPGHYRLTKTLVINSDSVSIYGDPEFNQPIILDGGKQPSSLGNLILITADDFYLSSVVLQNARQHLVQIASEQGADRPAFHKVVFRDGHQQLLKVSYDPNKPDQYSKAGKVTQCQFYFSAALAFQAYTGGIDAHAVQNWQIKNNLFKNIASPGPYIAEYAIHLWNNAANNLIEGNVIINSDRAIGLGLGEPSHKNIRFGHQGGIVRNNYIFHANNNAPFADVGIALESSPNTHVEDNWIFQHHNYPNAIEYRFKQTTHVHIQNNYHNKHIAARDAASAQLTNNHLIDEIDFISALQQHLLKIQMDINPPPQSETGI